MAILLERLEESGNGNDNWQPSIFMPRWASRITLEIKHVRIMRLQNISFRDCLAEGIKDEICLIASGQPIPYEIAVKIARDRFRELWDSINLKRGYGWETNCWVWRITFRRIMEE